MSLREREVNSDSAENEREREIIVSGLNPTEFFISNRIGLSNNINTLFAHKKTI